MVDGTTLWFGAAGFEVLDVVDNGVELVVEVETERQPVGCGACGTRAVPPGPPVGYIARRPGWRALRRVCCRKRIWRCSEPDCEVNTWTERR